MATAVGQPTDAVPFRLGGGGALVEYFTFVLPNRKSRSFQTVL